MGLIGFTKPAQLEHPEGFDGFRCGVDSIDAWVSRYARKAKSRGTAVVYATHPIFDDGQSAEVAGFYTLSAHSIQREAVSAGWLARNTPQNIPAILLGMLAVGERYTGHGVGANLLRDAVIRSQGLADAIGVKALVVDPLDASLEAFYSKYGFSKVSESGAMALRL